MDRKLQRKVKTPKSEKESPSSKSNKRAHSDEASPSAKKTRHDFVGDLKHLLKQCKAVYHDIKKYKDDSGRHVSKLFHHLPSREDYPDYFDAISKPIALDMIKDKIDQKEYTSLEDFKADIELMFENAKQYNTKGSQVYKDAVTLQKIASKEIASIKATLSIESNEKTTPKLPKIVIKTSNLVIPDSHRKKRVKEEEEEVVEEEEEEAEELEEDLDHFNDQDKFFEAVASGDSKVALKIAKSKGFDPSGFHVTDIFGEALEWGPLHAAAYYGLKDVVPVLIDNGADIELRDNGFKSTPLAWAAFGGHDQVAKMLVEEYHAEKEPENINGQIPIHLVADPENSRWSFLLQETDDKLKDEEDDSEDHTPLMEELLRTLVEHKDPSGRFCADMFIELPSREEYPEYYEVTEKPMAFSIIQRRIKKGYNSFEAFDRDVRLVFDNALSFNEKRSQVYKDAKVLLKLYNVTKKDLSKRSQTLEDTRDSLEYNGVTYCLGDFVYVEVDSSEQDNIAMIEKLWVENDVEYFSGPWYFRADQTFHPPSKKFYENEVFKSNNVDEHPLKNVTSKCYVMYIKDYLKGYPKDFEKEDVYVCESRYSDTTKSFSSIKDWKKTLNVENKNSVEIISYQKPLKLNKISSPLFNMDGELIRKSEEVGKDDTSTLKLRIPNKFTNTSPRTSTVAHGTSPISPMKSPISSEAGDASKDSSTSPRDLSIDNENDDNIDVVGISSKLISNPLDDQSDSEQENTVSSPPPASTPHKSPETDDISPSTSQKPVTFMPNVTANNYSLSEDTSKSQHSIMAAAPSTGSTVLPNKSSPAKQPDTLSERTFISGSLSTSTATAIPESLPGSQASLQKPSQAPVVPTMVQQVAPPAPPSPPDIQLLSCIELESDDQSFYLCLDTATAAHSISVGSQVRHLVVKPNMMKNIVNQRVLVFLFQNARRVQPTANQSKKIAPSSNPAKPNSYLVNLQPGLNSLEIWATIPSPQMNNNSSSPPAHMQQFNIFVTRMGI
ncbi:hypothetical protein K7432_001425 [Basidiobolus ranarum]|uniref:Polybromo-1 n=1 Tax=Basidiobolus ranarum TaxID=34480 RepID=A0ABR2W9Q1_9FUNG